MRLTIELDMEGEAFVPDPNPETARILRKLADGIESYVRTYKDWVLQDINGNTVGKAEITR